MFWPAQKFLSNDTYFFISAGADVRNVVYKGAVNDRGFDGVFRFGARKENIQGDIFCEVFNIIEYKSFGVNMNYVFTPEKESTTLLG